MNQLITSADMTPETIESTKPLDFCLDKAAPLAMESFPNQPRMSGNTIPATIPNLMHLLKHYGIVIRYDVIKKKLYIVVPGLTGSPENNDATVLTQIISLATLNGMSTGQIPAMLEAIADRNPYNPVADWIGLKPWDGVIACSCCSTPSAPMKIFPKS